MAKINHRTDLIKRILQRSVILSARHIPPDGYQYYGGECDFYAFDRDFYAPERNFHGWECDFHGLMRLFHGQERDGDALFRVTLGN